MNGFEILPSAGGGSDPLKLDLAGGTMTGQLVLQLASATGAVNVSPVWNNGATTFAGIYGRVTNTASGASSKLIDLGTVAGGELFTVSAVNGKVVSGYATNNGGFYIYTAAYGLDFSTGYGPGLVSNYDTVCVAISGTGQRHLVIAQSGAIGFQGVVGWNADTLIRRVSSGILAITTDTAATGASLEFREQTAPSAPDANNVRIYAVDNGAGKTKLMALFASGAAQQIAIEP